MRTLPTMKTFRVTALVAACTLPRGAAAQDIAEPIEVVYQAPPGCPEAAAFLDEITARTARVRLSSHSEAARTLNVVVVKHGGVFTGRLLIEEAAVRSSVREVTDTTCSEVVGALSLVAALAVDPKASTAPDSAQEATLPSTPAPRGAPPGRPPEVGPVVARPGLPTQTPVGMRLRCGAGAQLELATVAGTVFAARTFVDLEAGHPDAAWAPSLRLALARSLDVERRASVGGATLRFTQAILEACPIRATIRSSFALRPCVGVSAGILEAQGKDVMAARGRSRPWVTTSAHVRFEWDLLPPVALHVDLGALAPLYRDLFFFGPNLQVYRAPPVAFVARLGLGVRFP